MSRLLFRTLILISAGACLLIRSSSLHASFRQDVRLWAEDKLWHRLLHYDQTLLGSFKSRVDRPEFFLASDGKTNPVHELEATIAAFKDPNRRVGPMSL